MAVSSSIEELRADLELLASDGFCADLKTIARGAAELLTPPEQISTTECAARYRYIPDPEGLGASLWDPELTPYINPIQDAGDDPEVNLIVVPKPGRVGGTIAAENILFKRLKFGPMTDVLWYLGSDSEVDSYIDRTVAKMFELHPDILAKVGKGRSDNKRTFKRISGRILEYLQVNNKTITGRTGGLIVGDEIDAIVAKLRSTFVDQAFIRGTTLGSRFKGYLCSHMDAGWTSGIAPAWKESSRGIWYWPCPHCGGYSSPCPTTPKGWRTTLEFERLSGVSDDEMFEHVAKTAGLACPHCGTVIENEAKQAMNLAGVWVHDGQSIDVEGNVTGEIRSKRVMGFWIHGTMSPWVSWGDLARRYISALVHFERTRKPERLREVSAKVLGEVYEGGAKAGLLAPERLEDRSKNSFQVGTAPPEVLFITAAVDVGHAKFDVGFWGWDREGRSWLLDRVTLKQRRWSDGVVRDLRTTERAEDWMILEQEVVDRLFPIVGQPGMALPVAAVCIDVGDGNSTRNGREFGTRMGRKKWGNFPRVKLIRGAKLATAPELPVKGAEVAKDEQGNPLTPSVLEWQLGVHKLKELSVERLAVDDDGPGQCYFADGLPKSTFAEFTGEVLIDGKWERRGPNESLDCFDQETEVLTNEGWRRFPDLTGKETIATVNLDSQMIEYQAPTDYIARHHVGDMVQLKGRRLDILVTPNHRMVTFKKVYDSAAGRWNFDVPPKITLAKDLTIHHQLMMAADWAGEDIKSVHVPASFKDAQGSQIDPAADVDGSDFSEFLGWFVSQGGVVRYRSKTQGNERRRVIIYHMPGAKADRIRDLLGRLPWKFRENERADGTLTWTCASKQLYDYVVEHCGHGSAEKRVPVWIKASSPTIIRRFIDAAIAGNGWHQTKVGQRLHRTYVTVSQELADGMQELFIKIGCAANIRVRPGAKCAISSQPDNVGRDQYWVSELKRRKASLDGGAGGARKYIGEMVPFDGMVYCVNVPNGTLICRRNGLSFMAGNCFGYAEAARQMLKPDRADINWSGKRPVWARPVPIAERGGDLAVAGEGPTKASPAKKSIFERMDALNKEQR